MNVSQPSIFPAHLSATIKQRIDRPAQAEVERDSESSPTKGRASLWEILTPEEREFFQKQTTLTYRPGGVATDPKPAPLGRQVDVRG